MALAVTGRGVVGPQEGESLALAPMPNATDAAAEDAAQLAARLARNAVDSLPTGALAEKLAHARGEGRELRVKLGIDPTAPRPETASAIGKVLARR